jgi:hypothetical protein
MEYPADGSTTFVHASDAFAKTGLFSRTRTLVEARSIVLDCDDKGLWIAVERQRNKPWASVLHGVAHRLFDDEEGLPSEGGAEVDALQSVPNLGDRTNRGTLKKILQVLAGKVSQSRRRVVPRVDGPEGFLEGALDLCDAILHLEQAIPLALLRPRFAQGREEANPCEFRADFVMQVPRDTLPLFVNDSFAGE